MLNSGLYLVATPIGNINDISMRAIETLQNADIIACEDTRVTKKLFNLLNIKTDKHFISYQDYSEEEIEKFFNSNPKYNLLIGTSQMQ